MTTTLSVCSSALSATPSRAVKPIIGCRLSASAASVLWNFATGKESSRVTPGISFHAWVGCKIDLGDRVEIAFGIRLKEAQKKLGRNAKAVTLLVEARSALQLRSKLRVVRGFDP